MKFLLSIFILTFCISNAVAQLDTLVIDIENVALTMKKCEKYLFGSFRSVSSPTLDTWTAADHAFMDTSDTIYVMIKQDGKLVLEGSKLPETGANGEVKFYNSNSELIKIETWSEPVEYQKGDDSAIWHDGPDWMTQVLYKNGNASKKTTKSVTYEEGKGFVYLREITYYKNGQEKRTKIKKRYF